MKLMDHDLRPIASMKRFVMLDVLRGVAALAVVAFHFGQVGLARDLAPHGYLAVDLFFVLSGFVLAYAYEDALRTRLSWGAFTVKRVIRLYPLAVLGVSLGLVVLLLKWHTFPGKVDPLPHIVAAGFVNSFLLPMLGEGHQSPHMLFPGNGPLWSLSAEMGVNLLWAGVGVRMRNRTLAIIIGSSAVGLVIATIHLGTLNAGFDVATFAVGLVRVSFGFPLGVLIYRLRDRIPFRSSRAAQSTMLVALTLVLLAPFTNEAGVCWDLACVFVVFPTIMVLGIKQDVDSAIGAHIGNLSYPVYVLHFPILLVVSGLHQSYLRDWNLYVLVVVGVAAILLTSEAALRLYDEPLRKVLSGLVGTGRRRQAALVDTRI